MVLVVLLYRMLFTILLIRGVERMPLLTHTHTHTSPSLSFFFFFLFFLHQANANIARGKKPKVDKVTGLREEKRSKILEERAKREEEAKKERDTKIAAIEKEQKKAENDRQREIARRVAGQEAKMVEYESK